MQKRINHILRKACWQCWSLAGVWEPSWLTGLYTYLCALGHVWFFATPLTVDHQAPLSMEFSRQDYWSRLPFPSPGDLPDPGIELMFPASPALVGGFSTTVPPGKKVSILILNFPWTVRETHSSWTVYTNSVAHAAHLLSFLESGTSVHAKLEMPMWWFPSKNPTCWGSHGLPWWTAPWCVVTLLLEELCVLYNHATGFSPYLFTCWCTGLFLTFGFYKYNWYEHSWASLCGHMLCFFQVNTQKWSRWIVIVGVYL